jgi:hypothetical protein
MLILRVLRVVYHPDVMSQTIYLASLTVWRFVYVCVVLFLVFEICVMT